MTGEPSQSQLTHTIDEFSKSRGTFETFAKYICDLVSQYCRKDLIHTTQHRTKTIESFQHKCDKQNEDGTPKYKAPLKEITDLAGVRVIVFIRDPVDNSL